MGLSKGMDSSPSLDLIEGFAKVQVMAEMSYVIKYAIQTLKAFSEASRPELGKFVPAKYG